MFLRLWYTLYTKCASYGRFYSSTSFITMTTAPDWVHTILDDYSTKKFHIEYKRRGYDLSNHAAHGIIALWFLGCDDARIQEYAKEYTETKLNPPIEDDAGEVTDPESLLGKRERFNDLLRYYQGRLQHYGGDLHTLVQKEFPRLSAGVFNVVIHGLIHIGYGYAVLSDRVVCEGLAYLHHSYTPLGLVDNVEGPPLNTLGKGSQSILEVLDAFGSKTELKETILAEALGPKSRHMNPFQDKVGATMDFHSDELFKHAHNIKFPEFWDPENLSPEMCKRIGEWVVDCAVTLYAKSRVKNDFVLIHGVTGAWSLLQLLPQLSDDKEILKALRVYVCTILCVYLVRDSPILDADEEVVKDWSEIIKECVAEMRDEHIYKLVQVCHERYQKDSPIKELHLKACHVALKYELII